MMRIVEMRGKRHGWSVKFWASDEQVEAMRDDGIEVGDLYYSVPAWAVDLRIEGLFFFVQDLWNFRKPFGRR